MRREQPAVSFGVSGFIYGGDPEWVRRRYYLFWVSVLNGLAMVAASVANSLGSLSDALADTIVGQGFALQMVLAPGYILGAAWEENSKRKAGVVTVQKDTITQTDDPSQTVATSTTQTGPAGAVSLDPTMPPPGAAG